MLPSFFPLSFSLLPSFYPSLPQFFINLYIYSSIKYWYHSLLNNSKTVSMFDALIKTCRMLRKHKRSIVFSQHPTKKTKNSNVKVNFPNTMSYSNWPINTHDRNDKIWQLQCLLMLKWQECVLILSSNTVLDQLVLVFYLAYYFTNIIQLICCTSTIV